LTDEHHQHHQHPDADAELARFLREVVVDSFGYSATAARVVTQDAILAEATAQAAGEPAVDRASRFDLASLTKPFVATLATLLDAQRRLPLDSAIGDVLPEAHPALARRTLDDLLRHRSGLLPWAPLYAASGRQARTVSELIRDPRWWGARRGTYSDLGYLVYGHAVGVALGSSLAELLSASGFAVAVQPGSAASVVPCRLDTGREVELAARIGITIPRLGAPPPGRAQDGNARTLGGLPGHAGLFADLATVTALGRAWADPVRPVLPSGRLRAPAAARVLSGGGPFARGWRRATVRGGAGRALGRSAFGHDGFTGGSLWIDPELGLVAVLLGHRRDEFLDLRPMRRRFHRLARRLAAEGR
jgi:CubicO group peptidase (beta-lactamase class C family)